MCSIEMTLPTCHILSLVKKFNQKHRLGVGKKHHFKLAKKKS
jgi:hypothetical protein